MSIRTPLAISLAGCIVLAGCGPEDKPYEPKAAYSGKKPEIPQPPTLENKAKKEGDAYTVWGALHDIHSVVHGPELKGKEVTIIGKIVKINWAAGCKDEMKPDGDEVCVPKCAVFAGGKKDTPIGCEAPLPTFWIADAADEKDIVKKAIPVIGWACNWSRVYDLIEALEKDEEATLEDPICANITLPSPIPNVGAKVKVTGKYHFTATVGTQGTSSNPRTGILTFRSLEYTEKPEPTKLPYMD